MQCRNGSWGSRMRNNIFINDRPSGVQVYNTGIFRLDADRNVVSAVAYDRAAGHSRNDATEPMHASLRALAVKLPGAARNVTGVTREKIAPEFIRYGEQPWAVIEGKWWKLNPARPDFRPRAGSKLLAGTGDAEELPATDLSGRKRAAADIGALSAAPGE